MDKQLALITAQHCYIRSGTGEADGSNTSGIEDEIFSGWVVRLFPETEQNGWIRVETHYGYEGFIRCAEYRRIDLEELKERQDKTRYFRIQIPEADLLAGPKVQALPRELFYRGAFVELLEPEKDGWIKVRSAKGNEGYIHDCYITERKEDDGYFLSDRGKDTYFTERFSGQEISEEVFRDGVVSTARSYLGSQYRWGGKSSQGIDCSGLAFMSYMANGVLIYRDADIRKEYPIHAISRSEIQKGDLLFFPGHVAVYLGDNRYIHATANAKTPFVTINSLCPEDPDYREDLDKNMEGCGSLFPRT